LYFVRRSIISPVRRFRAIRYDWRKNSVVVVHNLSATPREVVLDVEVEDSGYLVNLLSGENSNSEVSGKHQLAAGTLWIPLVPDRGPRLYPEAK
jgi:hypothetical protein